MHKTRRFIYEHKRELTAFGLLLTATVLLCIPFTLGYAVRVFGWAVWFYLVAGYAAAIFHCSKKQINLKKKTVVLLFLAVFFAIATLHVAFLDRTSTSSFTGYIVESYQRGSAGGAIFGIITSPVAVLCTYVWAIVVFMLATAITLFFFFRPFIFEGTASPVEQKKQKPAEPEVKPEFHEIILDDSPFMNKKRKPSPAPIPYMTDKVRDDDPRELLFGGEKETYVPPRATYAGGKGAYDVTRYAPENFIGEDEVSHEEATELLFGDENKKEYDYGEDILNYDEPETTEVLFDDEQDESITDLLRPADERSSFMQALKQNVNERNAPSPIIYGFPEEEIEEEDADEDYDGYSAEEEPSEYEDSEYAEENADEEERDIRADGRGKPTGTGGLPEGAKISEDYVFYNGEYVRVVKGPEGLRLGEQPAINIDPNEEIPEQKPVNKIVQLVRRPDLPYNKPPTSMLKNHINENFCPTVDNWDELKEIFEVRLLNFGVEAKLVKAVKGPTVTLCGLELGDKCPIAKLNARKTDLQRLLKSEKPIAIIPQLPGTDYCGVQIPNSVKGMVGFKEILTSEEYRKAKGDIVIAMGKTAEGEILIDDLAAMPHALVAGETGSGKSVCLNVILSSIIFRYTPDEVKLILIDLKEVEMGPYAGLPHMLLKEPLSSIPAIVNALKWVREEVRNRFELFKSLRVRNLNEYNGLEDTEKLPRIVVIIDEASELMTDPNARKTLESTLASLARVARAAGIHLIFATQNPVKNVITNEIQNNLNTKIAFAVGDYNHSMVIFKAKGAECLLGAGDMYIKRGQDMKRAQCAYISTKEIEEAVKYIIENNEFEFDEEGIERILNGSLGAQEEQPKPTRPAATAASPVYGAAAEIDEDDETSGPDLMWQALKICVETNYVSCSYLQRKLKRGYNTIANVVEQLAAAGYITAVPQGSKEKRDILISKEDFQREWIERFGASSEDEEID